MWAQVQLVLEYSTSTIGNQLININQSSIQMRSPNITISLMTRLPSVFKLQSSKGTHSRPVLSQLILIAPQACAIAVTSHLRNMPGVQLPHSLQCCTVLLDTLDRGRTYSIPNTMARLDGF